MKQLFLVALTLLSINAAKADTTVMCITAMVSPDGTVGGIFETGGPQVIVLENGAINAYLVPKPSVIWNAGYKLSQPFNLAWVTPMGMPGTYAAGDKIEQTWKLSDDGKKVTTAILSLDVPSLKGNLETEERENGTYVGGSEATLNCSSAGVIH